ncbi:asparagine synthase-related protein, partial [Pseudomonadota bacterium]
MSGIAGIISFHEDSAAPGLAKKLIGAMANRGPDGTGYWAQERVGLGHCMLRTTPQSLSETQPLTNEEKTLALTMDGRLDNREELGRKLRSGGISLRGCSDSEYALGAYELWGEQSPVHLEGDFSFAVWDSHRKKLFCVRDRLGVKPLHYFLSQEYFAFASEEEAFLELPGFHGKPRDDFVAGSLSGTDFGDILTESWLDGVFKLPPGSVLTIDLSGRKCIESYWRLKPAEELRFSSDKEYEEALLSQLKEAVECSVKSLGNPALMLSGGIDSASIAGVARELILNSNDKALHTFSMVADEPHDCAETRNIRAIVRDFEPDASLVPVHDEPGGISDRDLKQAAWANAHPIGNHLLLPAMMYLSAARAGCRVMVDGVDGDVVTGTDFFYMKNMLRAGNFKDAWVECRFASENNTFLRGRSPLSIFSRSAISTLVPTSARLLKARFWKADHKGLLGLSVISRDFAKELHLHERAMEKRLNVTRHRPRSEQERHLRALMPEVPWSMSGF